MSTKRKAAQTGAFLDSIATEARASAFREAIEAISLLQLKPWQEETKAGLGLAIKAVEELLSEVSP